ncbi:DUF642 domain-containing protein [Streptomyces sp. NPDC002537]
MEAIRLPARRRRRALGLTVTTLGTAALTLALAPQAPAAPLAADGFENPSLAPGECRTFHTGDRVGAWEVTAGEARLCDTAVLNASEGKQSLQLLGEGTVRRSFDTVPGQKYDVRFDLAGDPAEPRAVKDVLVSFSSGGARTSSVDPMGNRPQDVGWEKNSQLFPARDRTTWVEFSNNTWGHGPGGFAERGPLLDNVELEPSRQ